MKLFEAMQAAVAAHPIVDDESELKEFEEPFRAFRDSAPYFEFLEYDIEGIPFRSDVAYVVANTENKGSRSVRKIQRSAGRTVVPPLLKIEGHQTMLNTFASLKDLHTHGLPRAIGESYSHEIQRHILKALIFAAEAQGKVVLATSESLEGVVREEVKKMGEPCSVVYSHHDWELLDNFPKPIDPRDGLEHPMKRPSRAIGEGVVLIIKDMPEEVGFLMNRGDANLYASALDPASIGMSALGFNAIGVWGDAPVVMIDIRPSKIP